MNSWQIRVILSLQILVLGSCANYVVPYDYPHLHANELPVLATLRIQCRNRPVATTNDWTAYLGSAGSNRLTSNARTGFHRFRPS